MFCGPGPSCGAREDEGVPGGGAVPLGEDSPEALRAVGGVGWGGGGTQTAVTAVVRALGAVGGPDPCPPREGEPGWRAGPCGRASCVCALGPSAGAGRGGPGPGSGRPGGWRSGAAGLKVRQAAGRAWGGPGAAPWRRAAGGRTSRGLHRSFPGGGRWGRERGAGVSEGILSGRRSCSCLWRSGTSGRGAQLVPEAWRGRWACSAAESLVEPGDTEIELVLGLCWKCFPG